MQEKKYRWIKIADTEKEIGIDTANLVISEVNGKKVTLIKHNDKLFACAYLCPHAGSILAGGFIDVSGNIVCPEHGYKFSVVTGYNTSGEGYQLKTFPVEQRADGIFIGF